MKKKLLIVNQEQFGYHIDYVEYCNYLKSDYDITYLCWDYNWQKIFISEIENIYVSRTGNVIIRNSRFILKIINLLRSRSFYFIFIHYFKGCSIIPLFFNNRHRIHLDIRSGSIFSNSIKRNLFNLLICLESSFFNSLSVISIGLRDLLKINKNAYILPLGANPRYLSYRNTNKISLLYVGTLSSRRIMDTIDGLGSFLEQNPEADIIYTIIGSGWGNELDLLKVRIIELGIEKNVEFKGYIPFNELNTYFEQANVGVSYIPITPFFNHQPATKTYEYLMAGMPVIATKTYENCQIINGENGVLIMDNPKSFAIGLAYIYENILQFNERKIRNSVTDFEWEKIVREMGKVLLKKNDE